MRQPGLSLGSTGSSDRADSAPAPLPEGARFEERTFAKRRAAGIQALHPKRLHRSAAAARGDAPRLYPVARRLRRRHADERAGRGADVPCRLPGADAVGQCLEVLELVQRSRSATGSGRALADRRITRQIMRDFSVDRGASISPGSLRAGRRRRSWGRPIRTSTRPWASIRAGLRGRA